MAENHPYVGMLVDMGFLKNDIIKAINNLGENQADNIDNIIDEIGRVQDAMSVDEESVKETPKSQETETNLIETAAQEENKTEQSAPNPTIDSANQPTQNTNISTTTDPAKSHLTTLEQNLADSKKRQEELKRKNAEIEARAEQARLQRIEREKKEKVDAEKNRRKQGGKMQEDQRLFDQQEMEKTQAKLKAERLADKKAMSDIKRKLAEDKEARRLAREKEQSGAGTTTSSSAAAIDGAGSIDRKVLPETQKPDPSKKTAGSDNATTRIQIRLPDGSRLQQVFKSNELLSSVRLYIELQKPELCSVEKKITLSLAYPRKIFNDDEMLKPLSQLNMVPSASLMAEVKKMDF